mmetsp:Transcript_14923/g.37601  ORF Transcript_14923/g.37601 Transcript_14923/m.37601 type:complete len:216 (+) Transcript_14923:1557-2204(+)
MSNLDLLSINQHTIELLNGSVGGFGSLVVNISVSLGSCRFTVADDLAGKNVSKQRKGIVQLFVVNRLVEVLDKDVSDTRTTKRGITLAPHDTAGFVLDHGKVHGIESTLGITHLMVVHISVTKRTTGDSVTAHTDRSDGSNGVENLKQETLVSIGRQITNIQRRRVEGSRSLAGRTGRGRRSSSCLRGGSRGSFGLGSSRHGKFFFYFFFFFFFF